MSRKLLISAVLFGSLCAQAAAEEPALVTYKVMTLDTALKAAQAAVHSCREAGYAISVAVVDRGGNVQVVLRDRFAGPHTPDTAIGKAWTAISFRTDTTELMGATQAGSVQSGARLIPGAIMVGGGMKVESAGSIVGGIGVSGSPTGDGDDACAKAGIEAIRDLLEF